VSILDRGNPLIPLLSGGCFHQREPLTPYWIIIFLLSHTALPLQLTRLGGFPAGYEEYIRPMVPSLNQKANPREQIDGTDGRGSSA